MPSFRSSSGPIRASRFAYTAPLRALFNVKPHDHGRPIGELTHSLDYPDLEENLRDALENLTPIERTVDARDGTSYVVRIRPYRTAGDKIDGLIVTFGGRD